SSSAYGPAAVDLDEALVGWFFSSTSTIVLGRLQRSHLGQARHAALRLIARIDRRRTSRRSGAPCRRLPRPCALGLERASASAIASAMPLVDPVTMAALSCGMDDRRNSGGRTLQVDEDVTRP